VLFPGILVNVHVPVAGKPLNAMLPVETEQVGWVIVPGTGLEGGDGGLLTTAPDDGADMQPETPVTLNV
jgi:hypothetical protein